MKGWIKGILGVAVTAGVVVGAVYGVKTHNESKLVADVVPISNINYYYWGDSLDSYGYITSDEAQNVYVDTSQKILDVYVEEGQQVEIGDPLLAYDVSEHSINIEQKKLEIERTKNTIAQAKSALAKLQTDGSSKTQTADSQVTGLNELEKALKSAKTELTTLKNTKTQEQADEEYKKALEKYEDLDEVKAYNSAYAQYVVKLDAYNEEWAQYQEDLDAYNADQANGGNGGVAQPTAPTTQKPTEPTLTLPEGVKEPEETYHPSASDLAQEIKWCNENIASLEDEIWWAKFNLSSSIEDKERELKDLDIELRRQEMELANMQSASSDGKVYATVAGTVKGLQDPDNLSNDASPFLTVSASDGLYVKGQISELYLKQIQPGMTISGFTWNSGINFSAEITSIDDTPLSGSYYSDAAAASTYYFTAFIEDASGLVNGEEAQLTITTGGEQAEDSGNTTTVYLEKMYIRKEDNRYYVFKKGEDETLVKQYITVGKTIYGSAKEVTSGLTTDDCIAFPYGKTAKEGVATKVVDYLN